MGMEVYDYTSSKWAVAKGVLPLGPRPLGIRWAPGEKPSLTNQPMPMSWFESFSAASR